MDTTEATPLETPWKLTPVGEIVAAAIEVAKAWRGDDGAGRRAEPALLDALAAAIDRHPMLGSQGDVAPEKVGAPRAELGVDLSG